MRQDGNEPEIYYKTDAVALEPGDAVCVEAGGGGGFGPSWERPAERVREDVRQGYVTPERAREAYGVALDSDTFEIDETETTRLRAQLAAA